MVSNYAYPEFYIPLIYYMFSFHYAYGYAWGRNENIPYWSALSLFLCVYDTILRFWYNCCYIFVILLIKKKKHHTYRSRILRYIASFLTVFISTYIEYNKFLILE